MADSWRSGLPPAFLEGLRGRGFDLVLPLSLEQARRIRAHPGLPKGGSGPGLALLVGHSAEVWRPFIYAWSQRADLQQAAHPFDRYCEAEIAKLGACLPQPSSIVFSHHSEGGYFPFQRLALLHEHMHPAPCQMVIHERLGLWFGLRALICLPEVGQWAGVSPPVGQASQAAAEGHHSPQSPCFQCSEPCKAAFSNAETAARRGEDKSVWLQVRESCPALPAARYSQAQHRYHTLWNQQELAHSAKELGFVGPQS